MQIYPPEPSKNLTIENHGIKEFGSLFDELKSQWIKVEFMQEYNESGRPAYDTFKRGDYEKAASLVRSTVARQTYMYDLASKKNLTLSRIRVYETPLSSYLRHYEIHAYLEDIKQG